MSRIWSQSKNQVLLKVNPEPANTSTRSAMGLLGRWLDSQWGFVRFSLYLLLGTILSWAFAPHNIFPVIFVIFPILILLIDNATSVKQAFWRGWGFGLGFYISSLSWIGHSFAQQDAFPAWLAPFAILGLCSVLAVYQGLVFAVVKRFWQPGWRRVMLFALIWTLVEIVRAWAFSGFPWHLVGSLWSEWSWMLQSVAWVGVFGLSFLTVLAASSVVVLLDQGVQRFVMPVCCACLMVGTAFYGMQRVAGATDEVYTGLTLRLVQANVKQREKWVSWLIPEHFASHLNLSRGNKLDGEAEGIDVLIWPETAVQNEDFDRQGAIERWMISRLLEPGSIAITGAPRYVEHSGGADWYNSVFVVDRRAEIVGSYDKHHLVPFGEYIPLADLLGKVGLSSLTGTGFSKGDGPVSLAIPGVPAFSPTICYEAVFPGNVIDPNDRPSWLLNLTNDGWFGTSGGPYQHLALARMRAVEEGMALVRAASTGISTVFDPYGREKSRLAAGQRGYLDSALPKPLMSGFASWPLKWLILGVVFVLCSLSVFFGKRN